MKSNEKLRISLIRNVSEKRNFLLFLSVAFIDYCAHYFLRTDNKRKSLLLSFTLSGLTSALSFSQPKYSSSL